MDLDNLVILGEIRIFEGEYSRDSRGEGGDNEREEFNS